MDIATVRLESKAKLNEKAEFTYVNEHFEFDFNAAI
jgi:hypothetical protein